MRSFRSFLLSAFGVVSSLCFVHPAFAQTPSEEVTRDGALVIRATPPTTPTPPPAIVGEEAPIVIVGRPLSASRTNMVRWGPSVAYTVAPPPPPRPDSPEERANDWRRRFALAGTVGVGAPLGMFGVFAEWNFGRWVGINAGAGLGATFGIAFGASAIVRPFVFGRVALFGSLGFSLNLVPAPYRNHRALSVPDIAGWIQPEVGAEYRFRGGFFIRGGVGHTVLVNTIQFNNREFGGWYGPRNNLATVGFDPVSAADARDEGRLFSMFYGHIDIGYIFR